MRNRFREKSIAEWETELGDMDICWGKVQNLDEMLQDPLFREREMVVDIPDRFGVTHPALGIPVRLSETPGSIRKPAVGFGDSTASILQELGYTSEQIDEFQKSGAIYCGNP